MLTINMSPLRGFALCEVVNPVRGEMFIAKRFCKEQTNPARGDILARPRVQPEMWDTISFVKGDFQSLTPGGKRKHPHRTRQRTRIPS